MNRIFTITLIFSFLLAGCAPASSAPAAAPENPEAATEAPPDLPTDTPMATETTAPPTETPEPSPIPPTETATVEALLGGPVHGIILFIGDGMGEGQRLGGQLLAVGADGKLVMDTLPVFGTVETSAYRRPVTDSGAGATALSTGQKTFYATVGVDIHGEPLTTILELAESLGWSTGLVTTVEMADATPAAFAAHVNERDFRLEIARQMLLSGVDVILGGGEDDFLPGEEHGCYPEPGHRGDGTNLIEQAVAAGFTYVCTAEEFAAIDPLSTDRLLGLFADGSLRAPFSPSLADMTRMAINILSRNPNGFFLMVEGGQIDDWAHEDDAEAVMQNVVGLDAAVVQAQIYALGEPNTLIIVTADHETGGMSISLDGDGSYRLDGPYNMPDGTPFYVDWESGSHTADKVPLTAQGPYSELLYGEYPNTYIYEVMLRALLGN